MSGVRDLPRALEPTNEVNGLTSKYCSYSSTNLWCVSLFVARFSTDSNGYAAFDFAVEGIDMETVSKHCIVLRNGMTGGLNRKIACGELGVSGTGTSPIEEKPAKGSKNTEKAAKEAPSSP